MAHLRATPEEAHAASTLVAGIGRRPAQSDIMGATCAWCSNDSDICPTYSALTSLFGSIFGQSVKASLAASRKISLEYLPSNLPNLERPAETIDASGFPFNLDHVKAARHWGIIRITLSPMNQTSTRKLGLLNVRTVLARMSIVLNSEREYQLQASVR